MLETERKAVADAVKFDIDDLVQIESALQEICNITAGIDSGDDGE